MGLHYGEEEVTGMLEKIGYSVSVINFNSAVYGCEAIRKAAHKFRGRLSVYIEQRGLDNEVRLIREAYSGSFPALAREFCNEVLDQELKERVACEMAGMRHLFLAHAKPLLANCA
jgi:His-Xaa-Ser system protein HxsD